MSDSAHLSQFRLFARYNSWVNTRIYDLVQSLPDEERKRDLGAFFHSIHGTLNHLLLSDRAWLGRFSTGAGHTFRAFQDAKLIFEFESLSQILYSDFEELRRERSQTDAVIEQWMQELQPEMLISRVHYSNPARKTEREHSLWFGLMTFFNHQTHHRGQITTLLHQLGQDYGMMDFLAMYNLARDAV